jgi:hypothetical protein
VRVELDEIPDPDDTGSTTFARYYYQAEVAFPLCLRCALVGGVLAVVCERFEDVLVEEEQRWRFLQIKTRDPGLGAWTFSDLLGAGGALRSLLRTHRSLGDFNDGREIRYEVHLEGAAKRGDLIERILLPRGTGPTGEMVERCSQRMEILEPEATALLVRTRVRDQLPPRSLITDRNIRNLQRYARHLASTVTESVYDAVVRRIETAMRGQLLAEAWPMCVLEPDSSGEEMRRRVEGKRLTATVLTALFEALGSGDAAVLEIITDPDKLTASELERKLVAAGANMPLQTDAKQLRANASRQVFELLSGGVTESSPALRDLDVRLRVSANAVAAAVGDIESPAGAVWRGVLDDLTSRRDTIDPDRLLRRDPMLLVGRLCELSDRCEFAWRP